MYKGKVEVDGRVIEVKYYFIKDDTIFCTTKSGRAFETHYKSLLIE